MLQDYHRFHVPVSGVIEKFVDLSGSLYTVCGFMHLSAFYLDQDLLLYPSCFLMRLTFVSFVESLCRLIRLRSIASTVMYSLKINEQLQSYQQQSLERFVIQFTHKSQAFYLDMWLRNRMTRKIFL